MKIDAENIRELLELAADGYDEHFESGHSLTLEDFAFSLPATIGQLLDQGNISEAQLVAQRESFCHYMAAGAERFAQRQRAGQELH